MISRPSSTTQCRMLAIQPSRAFFGPGKALGASLQLPTRRSALHTKPQSFVPSLTRSISALPHSRRRPLTQTRDLPSVRSASTVSTAAPPPSATAVSASSTHPAASDETRLTWNRFLQLRAVRRRFNLAASAVSATASVATGVGVLASVDLEAFSARLPLGLDPVFALGLLTVGCGALGWLLGPFAGNAAFGAYYRGLRREIAAKEKEFYQRVKRHRADPAGQSVSNPMPDYYGEKISSVTSYRQWLKDQRAFRKKREGY